MAAPTFTGFTILRNIGFFDIILPTLLVYSIIYGILDRVQIFLRRDEKTGKVIGTNRGLNSIVAIAIALIFVGAANITGLLTNFLPYVGLLSVLIITLMMLLSLVMGDFTSLVMTKDKDGNMKPTVYTLILAVLTFIAFIFTFGLASGWWTVQILKEGFVTGGLLSADNLSLGILLLLMGGMFFFIYGGSFGKGPGGGSE